MAVAALPGAPRSPLPTGDAAAAFTAGAIDDALTRSRQRWGLERTDLLSDPAEDALAWARRESLDTVVGCYAPVGPGADARARVRAVLAQAGVTVHDVLRSHDRDAWPKATRGFFRLKKHIPALLERLSR